MPTHFRHWAHSPIAGQVRWTISTVPDIAGEGSTALQQRLPPTGKMRLPGTRGQPPPTRMGRGTSDNLPRRRSRHRGARHTEEPTRGDRPEHRTPQHRPRRPGPGCARPAVTGPARDATALRAGAARARRTDPGRALSARRRRLRPRRPGRRSGRGDRHHRPGGHGRHLRAPRRRRPDRALPGAGARPGADQ
jgi:hypothetical protein